MPWICDRPDGTNNTWGLLFREHAPDGCRPARVIAEHKGKYRVATEAGEGWGEVAGRFHQSARRSEFPTTGDFEGDRRNKRAFGR
ncbi:MAG: hypothetical protein ABUR63_09510 [Verrucomicrobiota bacterium]